MIGLATAGMIGAGVSAGTNLIGNIATNVTNAIQAEKTRKFNREEAEKNRQFQKEMAQNNIKYVINQAKELGISPSLLLGSETKSLGGSQASVSGGQAHMTMDGISSATNGIINTINENNKLKTMEEMNEDKLQTMKEIQQMKISNTANKNNEYIHNDYMKNFKNKEDFNNNFLSDLDNVQI